MKSGYVRTELLKFYNKLEKTLNRNLTPDDIFNELPSVYEILKNDEEKPIGELDYPSFLSFAQAGYHMAIIQEQTVHFNFGG
jgi:hypothetical protein